MSMLRSLLPCACLLASLAACASAPHRTDTAANVPQNPACLATGSRIPRSPGQCGALGQSYSEEELRQTGQTSIAPALRMLDPAIH